MSDIDRLLTELRCDLFGAEEQIVRLTRELAEARADGERVRQQRDEAEAKLGQALTSLAIEQQDHSDHIRTHIEQIDAKNY